MNAILRKTSFRLSAGWIIICLILFAFRDISPIEFSEKIYYQIFLLIVWFSFPGALLMLVIDTDGLKKGLALKIVSIVLSGISFLFIAMLMLGSMMCGLSGEPVFEKKAETSTKIFQRSFDCGAHDSQLPDWKLVQITPVGKYFIYVSSVDSTALDNRIWRNLEN